MAEPFNIQPIDQPALTEHLAIDPSQDLESWRLSVPAKPACFVLENADGRPVLLNTVADLRHALVRRLGPPESDEPTGRVDYRAIVRHVRYRPVYSRFEANWTFITHARELFPDNCRELLRRFHAHWVGIDLSDPHPRFISKDRPVGPTEACFGPLPSGRAARRLIALLEDLFDLCREHHLLIQTPNAQPCAYKQMNRCSAPCDGSISMDNYREQLRHALAFLAGDRESWREQTSAAMKQAATDLNFEHAARLKAQLDSAAYIDSADVRCLRPLTDFTYLVAQPGSGKHQVRIFLITPGAIRMLGEVDARSTDEQVPVLREYLNDLPPMPVDVTSPATRDRLALAGWHLVGGPREQGCFLHLSDVAGLQGADWDTIFAQVTRTRDADERTDFLFRR